jgi:hypothetical protein
MRLRYKFVTAEEYAEKYAEIYPWAPCRPDGSEFLICGEGEVTEDEMNAHKSAQWPQPEHELTKF